MSVRSVTACAPATFVPSTTVTKLPTIDELAKLPLDEIKKLGADVITKIGKKYPAVLERLFNAPSTIPFALPTGRARAAHVLVPGTKVELPWLVGLGFDNLEGKIFRKGVLEDDVAWLPNSKATIGSHTRKDGTCVMTTDYRTEKQAFGVKLGWYDEFVQVSPTTWIGKSWWNGDAHTYVILDFQPRSP